MSNGNGNRDGNVTAGGEGESVENAGWFVEV